MIINEILQKIPFFISVSAKYFSIKELKHMIQIKKVHILENYMILLTYSFFLLEELSFFL